MGTDGGTEGHAHCRSPIRPSRRERANLHGNEELSRHCGAIFSRRDCQRCALKAPVSLSFEQGCAIRKVPVLTAIWLPVAPSQGFSRSRWENREFAFAIGFVPRETARERHLPRLMAPNLVFPLKSKSLQLAEKDRQDPLFPAFVLSICSLSRWRCFTVEAPVRARRGTNAKF